MSTRCNVLIKDEYGELWFYRHSDGYPEGALPTLIQFMEWIATKKIRNNVEQASGWLIILGNKEYEEGISPTGEPTGWKVGAYEPTTGKHGDISYMYTLDLDKKEIVYTHTEHDEKDDSETENKITLSFDDSGKHTEKKEPA